MKHIILIIAIALSFKTAFAQQPSNIVKTFLPIKVSLKDKKDKLVQIVVLDASLYVQGYDGDDLVIEPYKPPVQKSIPAEAAGLKNITTLTAQDHNTSAGTTGASIQELPQWLSILIGATNYRALLIKVPKNIHLKLVYSNKLTDAKVSLKDITGELELNGSASLVEVDNITGPLMLSSRSVSNSKIKISHVKWDAELADKKKFKLFLGSPSDDVDISVPADLKATFSINSTSGKIYSDLNLARKMPESNSLNHFRGDLNGGGTPIVIITEYGNVFIRKENK